MIKLQIVENSEDFARRLKSLKIEAVAMYSKCKFEDSEQKFNEAIDLIRSINPNHKEIAALQRSVDSCKAKAGKQYKTKVEAEEKSDHPLMTRLREELASRGARGIAGLAKRFKTMDVSCNSWLLCFCSHRI
jgi:hypothetical protein